MLKACLVHGADARRYGLTLVELIVVLTILVALGGLIIPLVSSLGDDSCETATRAALRRVRDVIVGAEGYASTMKYVLDSNGSDVIGYGSGLPWPSEDDISNGRSNHPQLAFLFNIQPEGIAEYKTISRTGWRGPYIEISSAGRYSADAANGFTAAYGNDEDPTPLDGWGNPIVLQLPDDEPSDVTESELEAVRLVSAGVDGIIDTPADELTPTVAQKGDDLVMYLRMEDPNP